MFEKWLQLDSNPSVDYKNSFFEYKNKGIFGCYKKIKCLSLAQQGTDFLVDFPIFDLTLSPTVPRSLTLTTSMNSQDATFFAFGRFID